MKLKLFVLAITILAIVIFNTARISSRNQEQAIIELSASETKGTISYQAKLAKIQGKRKVFLPGYHVSYANEVKSLNDALSNQGLIIGELIKKKSGVINNEYIVTWYKFKIIDNLTADLPQCLACESRLENEAKDMLPEGPNEILISAIGGSVKVEGVEVTMEYSGVPEFLKSQRYLLFLATDSSGKIGVLKMGSVGVFRIDPTGLIEPVDDTPHPLRAELIGRHNRSLDQLKDHIQKQTRQ